jgi:excisionase family DNA binding protein
MQNPFELITNRLAEIDSKLSLLLEREQTTPPPPPERYLTLKEAAAFLKIAPQTLYGKTCRRSIPFIKQGKHVLFAESELVSYLNAGKQATATELQKQASEWVGNMKKGGGK